MSDSYATLFFQDFTETPGQQAGTMKPWQLLGGSREETAEERDIPTETITVGRESCIPLAKNQVVLMGYTYYSYENGSYTEKKN